MSSAPTDTPPTPAPEAGGITARGVAVPARLMSWQGWSLLALGMLAATGAWTGWSAQHRLSTLESELVKRQQDSQALAQEAKLVSKQAQEQSRDASVHTALLETRLAEVALQRTQVDDLFKSMSRSRDENLLVDIEASLRVAVQQSVMMGSAEPLVSSLQTADERLARAQQPRLDPLRHAVVKDLDRIKATRMADLATLAIRLDEAIRLIDETPLVSERAMAQGTTDPSPKAADQTGSKAARKAANKTGPAASATSAPTDWSEQLLQWGQQAGSVVWHEAQTLIRITRIARPEAMLIAPDQAFFLRENIKLRLLNARLALLSRQTPTALSDLQAADAMVKRFFDTQSRKAQLVESLIAEVLAQGAQTQTPHPEGTLAALTTLAASR